MVVPRESVYAKLVLPWLGACVVTMCETPSEKKVWESSEVEEEVLQGCSANIDQLPIRFRISTRCGRVVSCEQLVGARPPWPWVNFSTTAADPREAPWYCRGQCRLASKESGGVSRLDSWFSLVPPAQVPTVDLLLLAVDPVLLGGAYVLSWFFVSEVQSGTR
jgi:hypothetical protein